jgi:hypothetical protein
MLITSVDSGFLRIDEIFCSPGGSAPQSQTQDESPWSVGWTGFEHPGLLAWRVGQHVRQRVADCDAVIEQGSIASPGQSPGESRDASPPV